MWQEVHQDEMEILGVPCGQFFNVRLNLKPDFDIFTENKSTSKSHLGTRLKLPTWSVMWDLATASSPLSHFLPGAQTLKPSNFESQIILLKPDPMWTEQRESPCTSGLWCGFRFNSVKTDNKQLQSRCPSPVPTFFEDANLLLYSPMSQEDVRWNWEKASSTKFSIWIFSNTFCIELAIYMQNKV